MSFKAITILIFILGVLSIPFYLFDLKNHINSFSYIFISILIVSLFFLLKDLLKILKPFQDDLASKSIYILFIFLSYSISNSISEYIIYNHTSINQAQFQSSLYFFTGITLIVLLIFLITLLISLIYICIPVLLLLDELIMIYLCINKSLFRIKILRKIKLYTFKQLNIKSFSGFANYIQATNTVSIILLVVLFFSLVEPLYKKKQIPLITNIIVLLSYYEHDGKTCNESVAKGEKIRLLDNNEVSIAIKNNKGIFIIKEPIECKKKKI